MKISSNQQRFFIGHTDKVNELWCAVHPPQLNLCQCVGWHSWWWHHPKYNTLVIQSIPRLFVFSKETWFLLSFLEFNFLHHLHPLCVYSVGICTGFQWQHNSTGLSSNWQPQRSSSVGLPQRKLSGHVQDSCAFIILSQVTIHICTCTHSLTSYIYNEVKAYVEHHSSTLIVSILCSLSISKLLIQQWYSLWSW